MLSVAEAKELGRQIGAFMKAQYGDHLTKEALEKAIADQFDAILKKSMGRGAPWGLSRAALDPIDMFRVQKMIDSSATKDYHGNEQELVKQLQDFNDDLYCLTSILKVAPEQLKSYKDFERRWGALAKALNTATAGSGLEWIPTGFSTQMIEAIELEAKVAALFYSFPMPANPFTFPMALGDGIAYKGAEATSPTPSMFKTSTPTTDNLTFNAVKLVANYPVSDELTEDSIIPLMAFLKKSIARAIAKSEENAILNGDTSATHMDTGDPADSLDARRCWLGLRKMCQSANKSSGSTWANTTGLALLRAMDVSMGKYALDPSKVKILSNIGMFNSFKALTEVSTEDKFGSAATVHNGKLTEIDGQGIVLSAYLSEETNASGLYDGVTTTKKNVLKVFTEGFWRGIRKDVTLEYVRMPLQGNQYLVAQTRRHFKAIFDYTVEDMITWLYNI